MIHPLKPRLLLACSALLLTGCATVPKEAGFGDVQADVQRRTGQTVRWNRLSADDRAVDAAVRDMMAKGLTAERAVQIALLNNRNLQATYEDLGIAQADVVQAGLLKNPVFDGDVKFSVNGGGTKVELAVVQDFLDVLMIPLRKRVAERAFEAAKFRVTGAVIDLGGQVRSAFYAHEAAEQTLELRQSVAVATQASYDLARRLREAGNIKELDLDGERAAYEQSRVDLASAEADALDTRERLNVLLGLWGSNTQWTSAKRLPDLPADHSLPDDIERQAVANSLDLAIVRSEVQQMATTLGIRRSFGLLPEAELGAAAEREFDGGWSVGPAFSLPIPLFDQGQAATAAARSRLERARQQYVATAVEVRSAARTARNRLLAALARANYYKTVLVPLRHRITEQTQLQYNAMQVGAFQLLQARQSEIEAAAAYVGALRGYWNARNQMDQIISGRTPDTGSEAAAPKATSVATGGGAGAGGH